MWRAGRRSMRVGSEDLVAQRADLALLLGGFTQELPAHAMDADVAEQVVLLRVDLVRFGDPDRAVADSAERDSLHRHRAVGPGLDGDPAEARPDGHHEARSALRLAGRDEVAGLGIAFQRLGT